MLRHFTNFVRVKRAQVNIFNPNIFKAVTFNIVKSEQVNLPMFSLCFFHFVSY